MSRILFDLSSIDLGATTVSPEEVAAINPQAGPMRQLDRVIWFSDDERQILGVKEISEDEFWVPHHIPGRPMMPGVLMIEAAAQLCSIQFHKRKTGESAFLGFTRCDDVAFRGQVVPGDTLLLLSSEVAYRRRRFIARAQAVVGDRLVFEATITGMEI